MLKEKRQLLFDYKKVFEALNLQRENHGDSLIPESTVLNVVRSSDNDKHIIISLKENSGHKVYKVRLSEELFIKGLSLFCVKHNIMFPQSGKKQLSLKKGKVVLSIIMTGDV